MYNNHDHEDVTTDGTTGPVTAKPTVSWSRRRIVGTASALVAVSAAVGFAAGAASPGSGAATMSGAVRSAYGMENEAAVLGETGNDGRGQLGLGWGAGQVALEPGDGLSNTGSKSAGWTLDGSKIDVEKVSNILAEELKLRKDDKYSGEDQVAIYETSEDGGRVWVNYDALRTFGAYIPLRAPDHCKFVLSCSEGKSFTAPSPEVALQQAQQLVTSLGLDVKSFVWSSDLGESANNIRVTGQLRFDGVPTPIFVVIDVSTDGIYSVSGFAAVPVSAGEYKTIGAKDAVERSSKPGWTLLGPLNVWEPRSYTKGGGNSKDAEFDALFSGEQASTEPETTGLRVDLVKVSVSDPKPGLGLFTLRDGRVVFLPTWELLGSDGNRWAVPAFEDRYVTFGR